MAASFDDFYYQAADGLRLHARLYGSGQSGHLPVICLPGLTRNARDFHDLAMILAKHRRVGVFDYRGRGQSDYDPNPKNYNVGVEANDVLVGLAQLGIERALFIGTSRGGIILHVLAMLKPAILGGIVLNDIGPVIESAGLQHIKTYLSQAKPPRSMAEAAEAQKAAHGAAFPALSDADWPNMAQAVYKVEGDRILPDFDAALLTDLMTADLTKPLPDMWPQFAALSAVPVLAIRGENSLLLSAETLDEMVARHPNLETVTVSGQGHAPFLETGDLPKRIAGFFDRVDPAT